MELTYFPNKTQARLHTCQGVRCIRIALEGLDVINTKNTTPVPADSTTAGEIMMCGNAVMKGYLKNPKANAEAFANGWFLSWDPGVKHPDGYIEVKDRSKDIIISGGEDIRSVGIENVLYAHPGNVGGLGGMRAAFGRGCQPIAFRNRSIDSGLLPKTATGKVQKHLLRAKELCYVHSSLFLPPRVAQTKF